MRSPRAPNPRVLTIVPCREMLSACADLSRPGCGKLQFGAIRVKDSQSWWRPALLAILLADGGRHSDRPDEPHDV